MKRSIFPLILLLSMPFWILNACRKTLPKGPGDDETIDGPVSGLSNAQYRTFLEGAEYFDQVFTTETGLGPVYVQSSCATCHAGVGRGHVSTMLVRFTKKGPSGYDPMLSVGGPQLQHTGIPGYPGETLPAGYTGMTRLLAPPVTGMGLLEAIEDKDLLAIADPDDTNTDGISGKPNWVPAPDYFTPLPWHQKDSRGYYIGRFGRKAGNLNMMMQTVNALHEDMGITTDFHPIDLYNHSVGLGSGDNVPEPELPSSSLFSLVFYMQTFKAPVQRNPGDEMVIKGKDLFVNIGCAACHTPTFTTGYHPVAALSNQTIHPYTDLLMHDMGAGLDDGYAEGTSESYEWRTAPLWGLGLSKNSQGGTYFLMHDGRAKSLEEAISMHGGEGSKSQANFAALGAAEKKQVIAFLESL